MEMNRSANARAIAAEALRSLQADAIAYRRDYGNGKVLIVERLLGGFGRICVGQAHLADYEDFWDYDSVNEALAEAVLWHAGNDPEPARWLRHVPSGRHRPGGCAELEYVAGGSPSPLE